MARYVRDRAYYESVDKAVKNLKTKLKSKATGKKPAVKTLKLEIEFPLEVYTRLRDELDLKVAMGNFYGLEDELTREIVKALDGGYTTLKLNLNKKAKRL